MRNGRKIDLFWFGQFKLKLKNRAFLVQSLKKKNGLVKLPDDFIFWEDLKSLCEQFIFIQPVFLIKNNDFASRIFEPGNFGTRWKILQNAELIPRFSVWKVNSFYFGNCASSVPGELL